MTAPTSAIIRARLAGAAWFGRHVTGGHCMGCQQYTRVQAAYNGGQGLGWGACEACIVVWGAR